MNIPNRFELFVLEDGEKAVEVNEDTKVPNAATIKVVKQDHTLANMLRAQLLAMPQVLFAGYRVSHPLQPNFEIRIQTDGSVTPQEILQQAAEKLIAMMVSLESKFKTEFSYKDADSGAMDDPYGTGTIATTGWTGGRDYLDF
ncbi:RBP11-like subunits of RNA polymerase [Fistulina hepatica ATCC 64428]|uniref:RBP11-like subunits of RNA polymerase n=1 Tax=Fistulina hepatica ATCC 64428 TaxID=1128425 RepID=A0A0D7ARR8_9AGAR|nr:RBP11-like subunits of RNA polymerase [Fistulina hepatica ATCC 64428]